MPSGKQVLLDVLQTLSQNALQPSDLQESSETLRSALCAHCSTSGETMEKIQQVGWLTELEKGEIIKQGLGLVEPNIFLSDLFETLIEEDTIPERVKERFPNLTQQEYSTSLDMIWWLLSSLQYWQELSSVENNGVLEVHEKEKLINGYKNLLRNFEKDPW